MCVSETQNEYGSIGVNVGQAWCVMMSWMSWIDKIRSLDDGVDCIVRSGEYIG
jgi:hypothetical protein